jgi:HK97 family phage prohead protease
MAEKEVRHIKTTAKVEVRKDGTVGAIYGYPIVYNKDSEDMGFVESIAPGAVKKALKRSDIRGLKNHDPSLIFARQGVNLKLSEDDNGLRYEATPIDTRNFKEVAEEVRLGLLTGQSFGFTVEADEWSDLETNHPRRTITEIGEIFDVGPVTYPAYVDTSVALRSLNEARTVKEQDDVQPLIIKHDGVTMEFVSEDRFDCAVDYINDLRSASQPSLTDADNADEGDPSIDHESDAVRTFEAINNLEKKYEV